MSRRSRDQLTMREAQLGHSRNGSRQMRAPGQELESAGPARSSIVFDHELDTGRNIARYAALLSEGAQVFFLSDQDEAEIG